MRIIGFIQIALGFVLIFVSFFFLFLMWGDSPVSHSSYEYAPGVFGILSIILGVRSLMKASKK